MIPLAGVVLCGGESSRMGRPKAWLEIGGETLLARTARVLGSVTAPVVVVAAPGQDLPPLPPGVAVARDAVRGNGPLQGLAAGIEAIASAAPAAFVSSTDAPFLTPAFVLRMGELLRDGDDVVVPRVGGRLHPLAAVYRVGVLPEIRASLGEGRLRLSAILDRVRTRFVGEADLAGVDPGLRSLANVNTGAEYAAALEEAAARRGGDALDGTRGIAQTRRMALAAERRRMTPEEYLAFERASDVKHEYADGEIFDMSGGTVEHSTIAVNITVELGVQLRDRRCRVLNSDMRIKTATGRYFYPDASVACGRIELESETKDVLCNPTLVVEVLSDSTEAYDRGDKFEHYRSLSSLQEYVLASQRAPRIEVFTRQADGSWTFRAHGPGEIARLSSIGCELAVDSIYRGVFDDGRT